MLKKVDCLKSFHPNQQNHGHKKIIKNTNHVQFAACNYG